MYIGGIEAGGTKFNLSIYHNEVEVKFKTIMTKDPNTTLNDVVSFFDGYNLESLGLACFGPINLNIEDNNYGMILNTPKVEWRYFNIYKFLTEKLKCKVYLNTDVALAAYAEYYNTPLYNNLIYMTVGTGIGASIIKDGRILQGEFHSEMGHVQITRLPEDQFPSTCPYHENCLEGLTSGVSLKARYNLDFHQMSKRDDIWDLAGYYLALGIYNYILVFNPEIIYIGGGVLNQEKLIPSIKKHLRIINNNYLNLEKLIIKKPTLANSGLIGAIMYAQKGGVDVR